MGQNAKEAPSKESLALVKVIRAHMALQEPALTQADLVRLTGIPQATVSRLLLGKREMDLGQLRAIARALRVNMSELVDQSERYYREGETISVILGEHARKRKAGL